MTYKANGERHKATEDFHTFLHLVPDSPERTYIETELRELEQQQK